MIPIGRQHGEGGGLTGGSIAHAVKHIAYSFALTGRWISG